MALCDCLSYLFHAVEKQNSNFPFKDKANFQMLVLKLKRSIQSFYVVHHIWVYRVIYQTSLFISFLNFYSVNTLLYCILITLTEVACVESDIWAFL